MLVIAPPERASNPAAQKDRAPGVWNSSKYLRVATPL